MDTVAAAARDLPMNFRLDILFAYIISPLLFHHLISKVKYIAKASGRQRGKID
jgi:hypothetical protein